MKKLKDKSSFTLLEILVSLLILSIAITGIMSVFIASRRYVIRSRHRLQATNIAREVLERLYQDVRADTWNWTAGTLTSTYPTTGNFTIDNITYNYTYTVSDVSGRDYCNVTVNINWTEPSF